MIWEIELIIKYDYSNYLMYLKENITNSTNYNKLGAFIIAEENEDFAKLCIAIKEPNKELLNEIKDWIAECIVYSEKEAYFNSKNILPDSDFKGAFLKSLVMVDIDSDIKLISKQIDLTNETINLHSLFKFRLKNILKKWDKLLTNFIPSKDEFTGEKLLDILKDIMKSNRRNLNVVLKKNSMNELIIEATNEDIYIKGIDEADIIANLILLSPQTLKINNEEDLSKDSLILTKYLFLDVIVE